MVKEQAKNNLITQNIELYPRAIFFSHTHTHTQICNYFELLEGLGRLAQLYFKFLMYAMNSKNVLRIIFGSVHMNTLRQTRDSGSYSSDDAHAPLLQTRSIVRNGVGGVG